MISDECFGFKQEDFICPVVRLLFTFTSLPCCELPVLLTEELLLAPNSYSLRTIHMIALVLYGLIRNAMDIELSDVENAAVLTVVHRDVGPEENLISEEAIH